MRNKVGDIIQSYPYMTWVIPECKWEDDEFEDVRLNNDASKGAKSSDRDMQK